MTLSEFLLARIAEDEAVARTSQEDERNAGVEPGHRTSDLWAIHDTHTICVAADGVRILAECEAKRSIVETFDRDLWCVDGGWAYTDFALKTLALPYASHPDYREEWRP